MNEEQVEALRIYCERQKLMISELMNKVLWLETRLELSNKINIEQEKEEADKAFEEQKTPPRKRHSQFVK
jgi:hypothetical protein